MGHRHARRCAPNGLPSAALSNQHAGGHQTDDPYTATLRAADVPPEERFARTTVYSVALYATPPHVARTVRHIVNCLLLGL
jgi:hypothetical protein